MFFVWYDEYMAVYIAVVQSFDTLLNIYDEFTLYNWPLEHFV